MHLLGNQISNKIIIQEREVMEKENSVKNLFKKLMNFEPCERTLNWEWAYWGGTINRWYKEGLPRIKGIPKDVQFGSIILGQGIPFGFESLGQFDLWDYDVSLYFDLDEGFSPIPYNFWLFPPFEEKVIYEDDKYIEKYGEGGIRTRQYKNMSSMPQWLEFPLKTRNDWEKIKEERFSMDSISQRFSKNTNLFLKKVKQNNTPVGLFDMPVGFFGSLRYLIGAEKLFILYYDDPQLLNDILDHLCNLWLAMAEEFTSKVKFDYACFWEDMAGKNGSLISPNIFRTFMSARYKKINDFLISKGINISIVDTDGKVDELIPLFLEVGINTMLPFEQQALNDLIKYRKKYPEIRILGGFDKNTLSKSKNDIDIELKKLRYLISMGGYIPYNDHGIPPNSSWTNFRYYMENKKKIIYETKVLK